LEKYLGKISIAHEHILDLDYFNLSKDLSKRNDLIGYIGRLSEEKGPINFIHAISEFPKDGSIKFLIGGDGNLLDKITTYLNDNYLTANTELVGWIPHMDLPLYLNNLKLLVIPSYSEGLPNIMLEAMACGTPVLATPVGAIPDIIKDGETGFLMENNSPECIAANVIRALKHPDLEGIAKRARALIEHEYTFERAVERWRTVLKEADSNSR
jgi:glycosyltransferase involved in cell wall biosynthesis